jgi:FAD/FMN-containing dehydrogenase
MPPTVRNFGHNVSFVPRTSYAPATEAELLAILDRHASGRIRAVGALHSWSDIAASEDVSIDLRHFDGVRVERGADGRARLAAVGGGCTIDRLIRELRVQAAAALPALGAIRQQTIAGAIATGTHGSGAASLSDLIEAVRVAAYDPGTGRARMYEWTGGEALLNARCGLGCTGIVTEVLLRCEPLWHAEERFVAAGTLDEVLSGEAAFPLQMFLLIPHAWNFLVYRRRRAPAGARPSRAAPLYRIYSRAHVDFTMHALLRMLMLRGGAGSALRPLLRTTLPLAFLRGWHVVDRYDRLLTLSHEWFRHEEMELAVPASRVHDATGIIRRIIDDFADRGEYTHHYPILYRRVCPDRALMSVTGGAAEDAYTISFFTYQPAGQRGSFYAMADAIARELAGSCGARPHWGKYFPLGSGDIERLYGTDRIRRFRDFCASVDPNGVFRNAFTERVLGM